MATITVKTTLDVIPKFRCLMQTALESDSIYARNKETLEKLFKDSALKADEKANIISQILGTMASSITASAMSNAVQWATNEVELELKRLEMEKQLDILDGENELRKAQAAKTRWESIAVQANTERMYGKPFTADGVLISLAETGKVLAETRGAEQTVINLGKEGTLLDSRLNESFAAIHKTVADTVVNFGHWTYSVDANGISSTPMKGIGSSTAGNVIPLSDIQRVIAQEQAKGYAYNAWANATTASAGMIGTAVASDGAITDLDPLVAIFKSAVTQLQKVSGAIVPGDTTPAPTPITP